ncbi:uncharacterized protein LOC142239491 [Haematobia irritans]|uniref:uncharacterized protein LOC142239491 n=1 Tax=Haematobia irritans TaxID=7368 RepID=UPI003F50333F
MMFKYILIIALSLDTIWRIQTARRSFNLELHRIICSNFSSPLKYAHCSLKKLATNRFATGLNLMLERPLLTNAEVDIEIRYKLTKFRRTVTFWKGKLNICNTLEQIALIPIVRKLFMEVIRSSNMPYACPIEGNILYNLSDFLVTEEIIPPYAPIMNFNYTLTFYDNHTVFAIHQTQGSTTPREKKPIKLSL